MFCLDAKKEKVFPTSIKVGGETFPINADFRNILKILRMLSDETILNIQKPMLLLKWFFVDKVPAEPIAEFVKFLNMHDDSPKEKEESHEPPRMCYEFDAKEIFASFLMTPPYANLFDIDFMHWHEFKIRLCNLPQETPLMKKINLRFIDLKDYKGKALKELREAKESVQLPIKYSYDELLEIERFEKEWGGC